MVIDYQKNKIIDLKEEEKELLEESNRYRETINNIPKSNGDLDNLLKEESNEIEKRHNELKDKLKNKEDEIIDLE